MTASVTLPLAELLVRMIGRGSAEGEDALAATGSAYDDLAQTLVPLISEAGFDALLVRALQLTQLQYPAREEARADEASAPFERVREWLEAMDERQAAAAAAALFSALAALLTTLIGESLTTRYLRKAWPDAFNDAAARGNK